MIAPSRGILLAAALAGAAVAGASPPVGATRLFIINHVNSNQIGGLAEWEGRLVAATLGGLVFLDPATGSFSKLLASPGGLPSNRILCVAKSPSGALWAGTADQGIARLKPDGSLRRTLTSFDGLPSDRVQALHVVGDSVWVGTSGGVALFTENPTSGQVVLRRSDTSASTGGDLVADNVHALTQDDDTLWCGTSGGLSTFSGGAWQSRAALLNVEVRSLALHQDTLWAATSAGPRRYAGGGFTTVAGGHLGSSIALHSGGGALHSGSGSQGAFRYTGGGWSFMGPGLPSQIVSAFFTLSNGSLWAGTENGFGRHEAVPGAWIPFRSQGPASGGTQRAVADARGVWFATGNSPVTGSGLGAVLHYDGQSWSVLTPASTGGSLQGASVFSILSDRIGKLWFGHCCSAGDPKPRTERWDPSADVWDTLGVHNLFVLTQAPSGLIYGGGVEHENGVYVFDGSTAALLDSLTPLNTQGSAVGTGLASNNLRGIAFDTAGRGWFAHEGEGLNIWDGRGTPTNHLDDVWLHLPGTGFNANTTAVVTTGASSGWVGTVAGVGRIRNDLVDPAVTAATNASLPSLLVHDLALDSGGNLWIATAAGLARVDAASGGVERWSMLDGLVAGDVRALAWDRSRGVLWVGTAAGISEVFPSGGEGPGFSDASYLYPNPLDAGAAALRVGGITDEVAGEVRDLSGAVIRRFRCDPVQNQVWDLRLADGSTAASGIYLVVLRGGGRARTLRVALVR